VKVILAPNQELKNNSSCGQRKWLHPHPIMRFRAPGVRTSVQLNRRDGFSMSHSLDSFNCRSTLTVNGKDYVYYSLPKAEANGLAGVSKLPYSMKVLLENLLRNEDDRSVTKADIQAVAAWLVNKGLT
jgi:aconitate hydratase